MVKVKRLIAFVCTMLVVFSISVIAACTSVYLGSIVLEHNILYWLLDTMFIAGMIIIGVILFNSTYNIIIQLFNKKS